MRSDEPDPYWGEEPIGGFSFGLVFFVLSLPAIPLIASGAASGKGFLAHGFVVLAVIYIIALTVVQAALQGIFQAALYQYAKKGEAPRGFDRGILTEAITPRAFG